MTTTLTCTWCSTPMLADYCGDGMHPYCGDPINPLPAAVTADLLGPCARCGQTTVRYGDTAPSTLCPTCQPEAHP